VWSAAPAPYGQADEDGDGEDAADQLGARLAGRGGRPVAQVGRLVLGLGLDVELVLQGIDGTCSVSRCTSAPSGSSPAGCGDGMAGWVMPHR
jgi:hypothetical protein